MGFLVINRENLEFTTGFMNKEYMIRITPLRNAFYIISPMI